MSRRSAVRRTLALLVIIAGAWSMAAAEDVEKKFRLGFALGGYNNTDEIVSDAANVLTLVDSEEQFAAQFIDPRNDSAVFGNLDIQAGNIATFSAQYAVNKILMLEASVGYSLMDVGEVDVQAQFAGADIPDLERFNFTTFRIPVGEIERIPLQFSALARFRPRASFNPYIGAGLGYAFIGFEPHAEFDALSVAMDGSRGGLARLTEATFGAPSLVPPSGDRIRDLGGATVDARDTFEWHLAGGAELNFKRKWAVFLDIRWTFASRTLSIGFDGGNYLGVPVPQLRDYLDSEAANTTYGAVLISNGGLLDGGSLQLRPGEGQDPETNCDVNPDRCEEFFDVTQPDGEVDPGFYYVQGGSIEYGGLSAQAGVRFTF